MTSKRRLDVVAAHLRPPAVAGLQATSAASATVFPSSYCMPDSSFTAAEMEQYARDGFVVKRGLVSRDCTRQYRERFRQLCAGEAECPGLTIMRDVAIAKSEYVPNERAVTKIQNFNYDEVLFEYCRHPSILRYVEAVTGPDIMAMHTMLINKPPDPGSKSSRHPLHQDLHYFPFRPANRIVCSWTALEHVHRDNGCLVVHPGSHVTSPLLPHDYPDWKGGVNKMYYGIPTEHVPPAEQLVYLEMNEGDTVFFHPLLIHGSGSNRTKGFRKAISCHYASSHCCYVNLTASQEKLSKEIFELAEKKLGQKGVENFKFTPIDAYRLRARLVAGVEGPLSGFP